MQFGEETIHFLFFSPPEPTSKRSECGEAFYNNNSERTKRVLEERTER